MSKNKKMVPCSVFFIKGTGVHPIEIVSFDLALRDAGIEKFNLVPVSSICPPGCRIVTPEEGLKQLSPGEIVFCVMARNQTNRPGRKLGASIGVAIPSDNEKYGYLGEHMTFDDEVERTAELSQNIAATMLAGKLGMDIKDGNQRPEPKDFYLSTGKISKIFDVTQVSKGDEGGAWTTTVAAAVFVL